VIGLRADSHVTRKVVTDATRAHAILAGSYVKQLKSVNNSRQTARKRDVRVDARIATSDEYFEQSQKDEAAKEEKRIAQEARKSLKNEKGAENCLLRRDCGQDGLTFKTTLKQCDATQLRNVAWTLGLLETGTKTALSKRISNYFNKPEHAALCQSQRYAPLFLSKKELKRLGLLPAAPLPAPALSSPPGPQAAAAPPTTSDQPAPSPSSSRSQLQSPHCLPHAFHSLYTLPPASPIPDTPEYRQHH
jgi:hypothetical protein